MSEEGVPLLNRFAVCPRCNNYVSKDSGSVYCNACQQSASAPYNSQSRNSFSSPSRSTSPEYSSLTQQPQQHKGGSIRSCCYLMGGLIFGGIGGGLTWYSYNDSHNQGYFYVYYGLIIVGVVLIIKGCYHGCKD